MVSSYTGKPLARLAAHRSVLMTFQLGFIDLLVLLAYLGSAVFIGLAVSGKSKNVESYLLGDRNLPWWAILGSIVATETSGVTVLSVPGEAYGPTGMKFLQLALGYIIGRAVIVNVLLPLYFRGQLMTAYEVLERRFGVATRQASSLLFLVARNLGDGLRLFLVAIVLQKLTGMPLAWSVVATGIVSIVYTFFGGMRSVVWNDCVQLAVYLLGGVIAVFVIAAQIEGGWGELFRYAAEHDKFQMFDMRPTLSEPYVFWAGLIGGAVLTLGTHGTDHSMVQRYLSARSQADAGRAILISGVVVFLQFALFLFIGIELACYFSQHPGLDFKKDEVFAHFIVHHFPANTGLIGLMLAAILASNLSSSLSACAAAVLNDFYLPWRKQPAESGRNLALTRGLTIAFGILQIGIGIGAQRLYALDKTVVNNALTIASFVFGLLLGEFALGVLTRRAGQVAALAGMAVGLAILLFVKFGLPVVTRSESVPGGFEIAFPWLAVIGAGGTFGAGWLVSWFEPARAAPQGATP
jgi:SSS family solute:Na+ symporter